MPRMGRFRSCSWLFTCMPSAANRAKDIVSDLLPASKGVGPLLQRDYWTVIKNARLSPHQVIRLVASRFWDFAPSELASFRRADGNSSELQTGDEMEVNIRMAGKFRVRLLHRDKNSLTIGTVQGHPEAGRITFGAYRNERGDVIFHIRSIARSSRRHFYAGFLALGEPMQTNTWTDFVNRVAITVGEGAVAWIHADKQCIDGFMEEENPCTPTFIARGD